MSAKAIRNLALAALAAVAAAGFWWALSERPVGVDVAPVTEGPMTVTIAEEGETRVRETYRISSPISGNVDRSLLDVGDKVEAGRTIVATINPMEPAFMDERSLAEARALADAASAAIGVALAEQQRARSALDLSASELERATLLAQSDSIARSRLERARIDVELNTALLDSAKAQVALRRSELASAQARLIQPGGAKSPGDLCCVKVVAPIDGVVLSLAVKSEQVVAAGAQLAEIGDPRHIEVVVDLLSSDAARIAPGTVAAISGWGGNDVAARVRRVDPAGFTKVSALGIEEKRVNAVLDLQDPPPALGPGFAVRVELEVWRGETVVQVPNGALFRSGNVWSAFVVTGGRASAHAVGTGRRNGQVAEVLSGLAQGDLVIVYPSDAIADGVPVAPREAQ
jgi:HlyD family secretion protein